MSQVVARLRAAVTDGRAQGVRHRQETLQRLHTALVANTQSLVDAIRSDSNHTPTESWIEVLLAVSCVRTHYTDLNLGQALREEYAVARREDSLNRKLPYGLVLIQPSRRTLLYSVLAPLAAALAAGNCVALYLERDLTSLNALLNRLLRESLDADVFGILDQPSDLNLTKSDFRVLQDGNDEIADNTLCSARGRVVAVVDRTADIDIAAQALVTARFSFGGASPYAPDLVLVNEFVVPKFLEAVLKHTFRAQARTEHSDKSRKRETGAGIRLLESLGKDDTVKVVSAGSNGGVVEVLSRDSSRFDSKVHEKVLQIHAVRSLDDAIDLANKHADIHLFSYIFASPEASKYLSQFIRSRSSAVNQLPPEILVGPTSPPSFALNPRLRYTKEMFQLPSPQLVNPSQQTQNLVSVLADNSATNGIKQLNELKAQLTTPLPKEPQRESRGVGFFEQGILTGAVVFLGPIAVGIAGGLFYGSRYVLSKVDWSHARIPGR